MKSLTTVIALGLIAVACDKKPQQEFREQREEIRTEYQEEMTEAKEEREAALDDAREELNEAQKEEAVEYVEEAEDATIRRDLNQVDVEESEDQMKE